MSVIGTFPFTAAALLLSAGAALFMLATGADVVHLEFFAEETRPVHKFDDLGLALILLVGAFGLDRTMAAGRLRRERELEAERLRVLKATMRTVHDIVNNFLNGLQFVRIEGEGVLPTETLELLDVLSRDTAEKLKALGDLETVPERQMASGTGIDFAQGAGNRVG
ncbi:Uncharacterized protein OS=Photobacterium profundum GN=PBPRB1928 PE=4 SV=1 [Gemmata massiliana]|uniref:Uncharacterized protein n=1 Tax=Gemmata massiliana TaxID=1210884 RepID=A0A6P2CVI0_9BACT|nr:hypothetical protein [Gemmata massiliana]VTR92981.1 Uncharacterized protein OS=Photobacterium profundum GN=PBPRB1928 PE=4 SV=1 [Gemmata massiliana]